MRPYHILVTCFDVSADHHAARLLSYLNTLWKDRVCWSLLGGEELALLAQAHENMQVLEHSATNSAIGLYESILEYLRTPRLLTRLKRLLKEGKHAGAKNSWKKIDCFLPLDGQARNLILGQFAYQQKIRSCYFFPPIVFVWGRWNIKRMRFFQHILCVFKPNWELYHHHNLPATYIGHPFSYYLLANQHLIPPDRPPLSSQSPNKTSQPPPHLAPTPTATTPPHITKATANNTPLAKAALASTLTQYAFHERTLLFRKKIKLAPHEWIIGIFPGSRRQEIRAITPTFLKVVKLLHQRYKEGIPIKTPSGNQRYTLRFIIALSHHEFHDKLATLRKQAGLTAEILPILHNAYEEILSNSRVALTCSGTITFKAAFLGVPHIIAYKISWLSYLVAKMVVKTPYIGMLNILHKRLIAPELINHQFSTKNILKIIEPYFTDPATYENKRNELLTATQTLYPISKENHPFQSIYNELNPIISAQKN